MAKAQSTALNKYTLAERQWQSYIRDRDAGHLEYVKEAQKFQNYYLGEQWDAAVLKKLQDEGRPALTINLILSTINAALGEYSQRQAQVTYKPKHTDSFDYSQVLSKLAMHTLADNDFESLEWDMVVDGFISDRGYLDVRMNWDEHMRGEVTMFAVDPTEILLDADAKEYDPNTWNKVTRTYWQTLDEIENAYGKEKRLEIEEVANSGTYYSYDSFDFERRTFGNTDTYNHEYEAGTYGERNIKQVRLISRQYKQLTQAYYYIDPRTGDMSEVPMDWDQVRREAFGMQFGLMIHSKPATRIRWTVTCDHVVLKDGWSPYQSFTIVPYFPYFLRGRPMGMVKNLIGSQDHLNKTTSQELHVINTTANSGWTLEEGTLVNMTEDQLAERGAETGLVLVHARGSKPPEKIKPNQIPTGLELISNKSRQFLREISGLEGVLGIGSPEISGVALDRKSGRANIQLQVPFTNLSRTRRILGRKLLELFQRFYTEHRILTITREITQPGEDKTEQLEINAPTISGRIANDITKGKYDVTISVQPGRDTYDDVQFAEAVQLREAGIMIPDHVVVRYSRLADREEIAKQLQELAGMAEPTEQELELMQMQQELAINTAQAELQKLTAEAGEIESRMHLNMAKAEKEAGGMDSAENQIRLQELEAKIQMKREELMTRIQLAQMTHRFGAQKQSLQSAVQLAAVRHQTDTQRQLAQMNIQGKEKRGDAR